MDEQTKALLKLALGVISHRLLVSSLSNEDFELLGYDTYKFAYYGTPKADEVRGMCEDIVFNLIVHLFHAAE